MNSAFSFSGISFSTDLLHLTVQQVYCRVSSSNTFVSKILAEFSLLLNLCVFIELFSATQESRGDL